MPRQVRRAPRGDSGWRARCRSQRHEARQAIASAISAASTAQPQVCGIQETGGGTAMSASSCKCGVGAADHGGGACRVPFSASAAARRAVRAGGAAAARFPPPRRPAASAGRAPAARRAVRGRGCGRTCRWRSRTLPRPKRQLGLQRAAADDDLAGLRQFEQEGIVDEDGRSHRCATDSRSSRSRVAAPWPSKSLITTTR